MYYVTFMLIHIGWHKKMKRKLFNLITLVITVNFFSFIKVAIADNLTIDTDATWETGEYTYDDVLITNGATLTFDGAVTINAANLTIDTGASISADGKGYPGQLYGSEYNGPGGGNSGGGYNSPGSGAGYGGKGGNAHGDLEGGSAYGNPSMPVDLGSGGGRAKGSSSGTEVKGGDGGGAIKLVVFNTLTVNGVISADGDNGDVTCRYGSGGGSGGSIDIITNTITGFGNITADGGNGGDAPPDYPFDDYDGGGGTGGRIAIYYDTNTFTGNVTTNGAWGYQYGEDGTVVIELAIDTDEDFIFDAVDNCPDHPNGEALGTCVETTGNIVRGYRVGDPKDFITCTSDADCEATGGTCQMEQADSNGNGCGDVCECYADFNGDFKVTGIDLALLKQEYGRFDCSELDPCYADGNEDGKVTGADLSLLKNEYGRFDCPACP